MAHKEDISVTYYSKHLRVSNSRDLEEKLHRIREAIPVQSTIEPRFMTPALDLPKSNRPHDSRNKNVDRTDE